MKKKYNDKTRRTAHQRKLNEQRKNRQNNYSHNKNGDSVSDWASYNSNSREKWVNWRNNGTTSYRNKIKAEYLLTYGIENERIFCCEDCAEQAVVDNFSLMPFSNELVMYCENEFLSGWQHHHLLSQLFWFLKESQNPEYQKLCNEFKILMKNGGCKIKNNPLMLFITTLIKKHEDIEKFLNELNCKLCCNYKTTECELCE